MYMRDPKDYLQPTDISIELRTLKEIFSNSCKKKKKKKIRVTKNVCCRYGKVHIQTN